MANKDVKPNVQRNKQDALFDSKVYRFNVHATENEEDSLEEVSNFCDGASDKIAAHRVASHPLDFSKDAVEDEESDDILDTNSLQNLTSRSAPVSKASTPDDILPQKRKNASLISSTVQHPQLQQSQPTWKQMVKDKDRLFSGIKSRLHTKLDTIKDRVSELSTEGFDVRRWRTAAPVSNDASEVNNLQNSFSGDNLMKEMNTIEPVSADFLQSSAMKSVIENDAVDSSLIETFSADSNSNKIPSLKIAESVEIPLELDVNVIINDTMRPRSTSLNSDQESADEATEEMIAASEKHSFSLSSSVDDNSAADSEVLNVCDPFGGSSMLTIVKAANSNSYKINSESVENLSEELYNEPSIQMSKLHDDFESAANNSNESIRQADTVQNKNLQNCDGKTVEHSPSLGYACASSFSFYLNLIYHNLVNRKMIVTVIIVTFAVVIPISSFLTGFLLGVIMACSLFYLYLWLFQHESKQNEIDVSHKKSSTLAESLPELNDKQPIDGRFKVDIYLEIAF